MEERPYPYHHVQEAPQWVVGLLSLLAIAMFWLEAWLLLAGAAPPWLALLLTFWIAAFYLTVISATRLTTRVGPMTVKLAWRLGWPTKTIDRASILGAKAHRNTWLAGWGIRKVTRGWMWNVWGLDAVELELDSGNVFRIGTDDQEGLLAALDR